MSVRESFAPSVRMPDGKIVCPRGWEWILAFAMAGCDWAIQEADKPEFRKMVRKDIAANRLLLLRKQRDQLGNQLKELDELIDNVAREAGE